MVGNILGHAKKSQRREAVAFITHIFLWCPVRDSLHGFFDSFKIASVDD
jgi:hypothetical protein